MDIKAAIHAYNRAKHEQAAGWEERCMMAAAPHLQIDLPQELTEEQIEKAAKAMMVIALGDKRSWDSLSDQTKNCWRKEAIELAPMLQYAPAPPQLPGDIVEAMVKVYMDVTGFSDLCIDDMRRRTAGLTAAAQMLLERICEESKRILCGGYEWRDDAANKFADHVRNSLLKPTPPTLEEELSKFAWETVITNKDWTRESLQAGIREILTRHIGASHDHTRD